jgi:diguanylate cyclase (GGDEF)-like protein/PAS domain S-box-containing protein
MELNMDNSREFLRLVLDSITEQIAVIDSAGDIQFVNKSWMFFGSRNAGVIGDKWVGVNYLEECDKASSTGDDYGTNAGKGIRGVIDKRQSIFYFEYPCHSPGEKRWFMMRVTSFDLAGKEYFVISHQNITERKLAEEAVENMAKIDGLTGIYNRRTFDEFLDNEWRRCLRFKKPICLAIIDLDHFKLLNDTYGHQMGDECLVKIGELLKLFSNRPSDLCSRYGGEEFAIIWGDSTLEQAKQLSDRLLKEIIDLNIPNTNSPTEKYVTASIGLAEMVPDRESKTNDLIAKADGMLYKAKELGRNQVVS